MSVGSPGFKLGAPTDFTPGLNIRKGTHTVDGFPPVAIKPPQRYEWAPNMKLDSHP